MPEYLAILSRRNELLHEIRGHALALDAYPAVEKDCYAVATILAAPIGKVLHGLTPSYVKNQYMPRDRKAQGAPGCFLGAKTLSCGYLCYGSIDCHGYLEQ